jgi:hypothetical protein
MLVPVAISVAVTIVIALITFAAQYGGMRSRLTSVEGEVDRLRARTDSLWEGLLTTKAAAEKQVAVQAASLDVFLRLVRPKGNPISQPELDEFKALRDRVSHGELLARHELAKFDELSKKVEEDLPNDQKLAFALIIGGIIGLMLGLILAGGKD